MYAVIPLLVVLACVGWRFRRHTEPADRAHFLRRAALVVMLVFSGLVGTFVAGETFDDPGGWEAVGWVAAWAVPLAAGSVVAWRWPGPAAVLFGGLTGAELALTGWYAADTNGWDAFEDRHGPIGMVAAFALLTALAFLAFRRPVVGGTLMLVVAVVPGAATIALGGAGAAAAVALGAVPLLSASLFLASAWWTGRMPPCAPDVAAPPTHRPMAA